MMFCPKCGQQSSEEFRFCPRCGLSLAGLPAYVAANDAATARPEPPRPALITARRRGMRRGAKLMFFSVVLLPLFLLFSGVADEPAPMLIPLAVFFAGLAWLVYARLFSDHTLPVEDRASRRDLAAPGDRPALGAPSYTPAS